MIYFSLSRTCSIAVSHRQKIRPSPPPFFFFFRLPSNAFPDNGSDGRIEKKKKRPPRIANLLPVGQNELSLIFVTRKINKSVQEKVCLLKVKLILNGCYSGQDLQLFSEDEELSESLLVEELLKKC